MGVVGVKKENRERPPRAPEANHGRQRDGLAACEVALLPRGSSLGGARRAAVSPQSPSSPKNTILSEAMDPMIGSFGWKQISLTLPVWPGSRYASCSCRMSQMSTFWSAEPAASIASFSDHRTRNKFFSKLCFAPRRTLRHLFL